MEQPCWSTNSKLCFGKKITNSNTFLQKHAFSWNDIDKGYIRKLKQINVGNEVNPSV